MEAYSRVMDDCDALEVAERAGIDLGLLEDNLRLTYAQRAIQHQAALDFALEIERAGQELRERSATSPETPR
jgi:hypothetical protein